jgi:hypothetical protein
MRRFVSFCLCFTLLIWLAGCSHASDAVAPPLPVAPDASLLTAQSLSVGRTIPFFASSFIFRNTTYTDAMVGSNPFAAPSSVTIPTVIIPVELRFGTTATFAPATAVREIQQSPIFHAESGYAAGTLQYGDAVMRSEFWSFVHAKNYHVILAAPIVEATKVLTITSSSQGFIGSTSGVRTAFLRSQYFLDPGGIEQQLLAAYHIAPGSLTIFAVTSMRVVEENGNCCYNGYHTSYTVATATGTSTFTTVWGNVSAATPLDLSHVSHEVAEWLNDPFYSPPKFQGTSAAQFNRVPTWIHPVTNTCYSNQLEVGDPLVAVHFVVNGFTVQDEAFLPWFRRTSPSFGIAGRYDLLGKLAAQPRVC